MPKIDLCFNGWLRGVEVEKVTNLDGDDVDVKAMPSEELSNKLNNGELFVSLSECLDLAKDEEIELFDFEESV